MIEKTEFVTPLNTEMNGVDRRITKIIGKINDMWNIYKQLDVDVKKIFNQIIKELKDQSEAFTEVFEN